MSDTFEIALQKENRMDELLATTWYAFEKDGGVYEIIGRYSYEDQALQNACNALGNPDDIAFVMSANEIMYLADGIRKDMDKKLQTELLGY
jgi:hypothetical protein